MTTLIAAPIEVEPLRAERSREMPRVDLLPAVFAEQERFRRVRVVLGGVVVLAVLATGGVYSHQRSLTASVQDELAATRAQNNKLLSAQARYAAVPKVYAAVDAAKQDLVTALGNEILFSHVLADLAAQVPATVWLSDVQVTEDVSLVPGGAGAAAPTSGGSGTAAAPAASATAVLAPGSIALVTVTGKATSQAAVASWLTNFSRGNEFTRATFTSAVKDADGVVTFSSTLELTSSELSHRYDSAGN